MQRYIIVLLWILILAVILLSVPTKCNLGNKVENFDNYYGYYKNYCGSCHHRGRRSCGKCTNCGLCITADGHAECVPGDAQGPYFREDCAIWEFGDPMTFYNGSNVYPIVKQRNVYPYTRWNWWRNRFSKRGKRMA
jgi:hypothetical protein